MARVYDYRDYDKYLSLKPDTGIWLVVLYLLRPFIVLLASVRMGRGGAGDVSVVRQLAYPDNFSLILGILASIPALIFIVAWAKRAPGASAFIRRTWHRGARLLGAAAAFNVVIVFVPLLTGTIRSIHAAGWVQVALSFAIVAYLFTSKRVRDTFADFPPDTPDS